MVDGDEEDTILFEFNSVVVGIVIFVWRCFFGVAKISKSCPGGPVAPKVVRKFGRNVEIHHGCSLW